MTKDEELNQIREENTALRAQVAWLTERLSVLEAKPAKDSHNSHLPPSSDRFHRQPKSLRKKSGKKPGGQTDHPGSTLQMSQTPDTVIIHPVDHCQHGHHGLAGAATRKVEPRQSPYLPHRHLARH